MLDLDPATGKVVTVVVAFFSENILEDFARFGLPATPPTSTTPAVR